MLLASCATTKLSGEQLARVAKDWSLSIRASQVIPVYPLTEDLQPGDIFLVQTPIEDQVKIYQDKGFLPLENLIARLHTDGYRDFYRGWPGVVDGAGAPPRVWQFPSGDAAAASFAQAPLAAFPSYSFSVSRSGGLNVAIPVQGVPIGLNLLNSASATGTITMKDAHTYGLPAKTLFDALEAWRKRNIDYLGQFEPVSVNGKEGASKRYFYLRLVNRVYLVRTVDVSLFSNRAAGGTASAEVPQSVGLLNIGNGTDAAKRFDDINRLISGAPGEVSSSAAASDNKPLAGGTVKVAVATSRSISMVESFARPLVIGYLAFDFPVLKGGEIGAPVATLAELEGRPQLPAKAIQYQGCDKNCERLRNWLREGPQNKDKLGQWLLNEGQSIAIADLLTGPYSILRQQAVSNLIGQ